MCASHVHVLSHMTTYAMLSGFERLLELLKIKLFMFLALELLC